MPVLVSIALRNLLRSRRRAGLLGLALGLVTLLLVLLLSLSHGIHDNLVKSATTLTTGHVTVAGFYKTSPTQGGPMVTDAAEIRKIIEANTPGLDHVTQRGRGFGKVVSDAESITSAFSGVVADQEQSFLDSIQLAPEREYKDGGGDAVKGDANGLKQPNTLMLFASQARRLQVDVGDEVTIQTQTLGGVSNTQDVTVVAIARDIGLLSSFTMIVPQQVILDLYRLNPDTTGAFWVYLKDISTAKPAMETLRKALGDAGYPLMEYDPNPFFFKFETVTGEDWTGQKLDLTIWEDEVSFLMWVLTAFDTITGFLTGVLVVIVAVGIMNAMWNAVRERTREIGTMRAIGMGKGQVLVLFLLEALFLGVAATSMGAALATVVALGVDAAHVQIPVDAVRTILLSDTLHLAVNPGTIVGSVVVLSLFTVLAAVLPAWRAAQLKPVVALQQAE